MHQVFMLPPERSLLRHFKRGNAFEICDRVMFDFYRWLSHVSSMFQIILSQSCFNFTGTWALCNHVFLGSIKSLSISKMVPEILSIFFSSMVISFGLFIPPHLHNSGRLKQPLGLKICFLQVLSVKQGPVEHKMRILVQPRQKCSA